MTADNKSRLFGAANPPLTATLTGFVLGQTAGDLGRHRDGVVHDDGNRVQPGGDYPITCTVGSLASANYSFGPFVPGTLTVTYTAPCLTGTLNGQLKVAAGEAVCIGPGAGERAGHRERRRRLDVEGGTIIGPVARPGAGVVRICGATRHGPLTITGSTGLVLVGGDAATGACAANRSPARSV